MFFDEFSVGMMMVSPIVGFLTVVIVGSQAPEDARSISFWTLLVLGPMLLVSSLFLGFPPRWDRNGCGTGMLVFFLVLILSVRLGHRVAKSRELDPHRRESGKEAMPGSWDDELGA